LFYHVFGRFSVRGVQKHNTKISPKKLTNPSTFMASEEATNHVGVRLLCLRAPWLSVHWQRTEWHIEGPPKQIRRTSPCTC
jgi:hypothetical protein